MVIQMRNVLYVSHLSREKKIKTIDHLTFQVEKLATNNHHHHNFQLLVA